MVNVAFHSTYMAMKILEKLIKARPVLHGLENLSNRPTLFVVNHFTRTETFILPYMIYKATGKFVYSLTDATLFKGKFGEYLGKIGAVSTEELTRNQMIIRDLLTGQNNWVIYPEGMMVKNKNIFGKGKFRIKYPGREKEVKTGAATLALLAEMYRLEYWKSIEKGDHTFAKDFEEFFNLSDPEDVSPDAIEIVPVNITYYPLRPGQNILKNMISKFFKKMPERLEEELEIEGNILMSKTDMDISFCKPLSVKGFVGKYHFLRKYTSWLFSTETCSQMVVSTHRRKLTDVFMKDIYTSVIVNFDHVFCMALESIHHFQMNKMLFLQSLYVAVQKMKDIPTYSFHETLHEEIIDMFYEDSWTPLQSIVDLAKENGILEEKESHYKIHKIQIALRYILHDARLKNTIQVITNELRPLKPLVKVIKDQVNAKPRHLKKALIKEMIKEDEQIFRKDHQESFSLDLSQDKVLGKPFMLKHNNNAMGVVLCHGYLSLPAQMNNLAVHLHKLGMNVYVVRLKGHGTVPSDISKVTMEDWRRSFDRAYAVMSAYCRKVVVGGFSLGGIMALWRAAQYKSGIQGVFSINAPIKLCDMKAHFVKSIGIYNSLLDSLNLDGVTLESIDNHSECADLNYNKNYLKGIVQLNRSVSICWNNLAKVKVPTLLIQAANDPVVKSQSAQMIYDRLGSTQKELVMLPLDHHNILYFDGAASVHQRVEEFLQELI